MFFLFLLKKNWDFVRDYFESLWVALGSMDILIILILPIYDWMSFHLFVSALVSFISALLFLVYKSFTSLVKFIPKYFILFFFPIVLGLFS